MNSAPLPRRAEHAGNRVPKSVVGVRDHQLDAPEPTLDQALQKARPERLGLRGANTEPDDLAATVARYRHSDYRRHRD